MNHRVVVGNTIIARCVRLSLSLPATGNLRLLAQLVRAPP
jgi:hypothetical protein